MKSLLRFLLLLTMVTSFAQGGAKLQPREETFFIFENRKLTIALPSGFGYVHNKDERGIAQVKIGDPKNRVSLDIVFVPDPDGEFKSARARRELLDAEFRGYVDSSSEKAMQFDELEPRTGAGTFCVFTDSNLVGKTELPPGEYLHLTAGVKTWPGVLAIFRLFSNDTTSAEYQATMKMLRESVSEKPVPLR